MSETGDTWYWEKTWSEFRRGKTQARLLWDGGEARVLLFDEGTPETATAVIKALPVEIPVVHVAWSGDMVMSTRGYDIGVTEHEHHVRLVHPGDLAFDPKFGELTVTYGTAEARLPSGANTLVVFGQITQGLEAFAAWGRARRFEGLGTLKLVAEGD
jgi:hypothetical protein